MRFRRESPCQGAYAAVPGAPVFGARRPAERLRTSARGVSGRRGEERILGHGRQAEMNLRAVGIPVLATVLALWGTGCDSAPGKPVQGSEEKRPDQVVDFETLYGQNCAACHGENGRNGTALSLANPVYLAAAGGANIQ